MELTDDIYNNNMKPMLDKMKELKAAQGWTAEDDQKQKEWREANTEEAKQEFMATW